MKLHPTTISLSWVALGCLIIPGVLVAEIPLSQDAEGNVWFRTPNNTVLMVGANGDVAIDGKVLINCRQHPGGEVDLDVGEAECYGGYFELEDSYGNELEVYPTYAEAEDDDGNEYKLPLGKSPVGPIRIDLSDGIRVETEAETVTVGGDGKVVVTGGGQQVIVDGDNVRIPTAGVEISGDWRGAGTVYAAGDTERILVELGATQQGDLIRLALAGDIMFEFDSTAVRADAAAQLAKAAHVIRQRAMGEVYVVGHTDSIGGDDYNHELSRDRAVAVMSWLEHSEGVPAAIMVGRGMGSKKPVAHNTMPDGSDNPEGRARNRRVEILLATREGVDVINVAGLVTVGAHGVDVGGGAVRVSERGVEAGGGAIKVDPGGVRVGGVEVTAGGVRVGGVTVDTGGVTAGAGGVRAVSDEVPAFCKSDETCNLSCPHGDCSMTCESGAECVSSCSGGDCRMTCAADAECVFSCSGGDCVYDCADGSSCRTTCTGDGCVRR